MLNFEIRGLKADDDAEAILKSAFALNEGVVVDCEIPIDDKVLPMVAPGASINDMMGFIDNEGNWVISFSWHRTWLLKFLGKSSVKHSQIHQVSYSISALRN